MDTQYRGPVVGGTGTPSPFTADFTGASRVTDAHGRYAEANRRGSLYGLSAAAAAATAFTGGAGGTPMLAVYNPANSVFNLEILMVGLAGRVAASAAGTVGLTMWGGVSVQPTGTQTVPRNQKSLAQAGSSALGFSNAALTGSTAINLLQSLASYYWATAAGAFMAPAQFDIAGSIIVAPGNLVAFGLTAALTSATYDAFMLWEEVPNLA